MQSCIEACLACYRACLGTSMTHTSWVRVLVLILILPPCGGARK